MTPNLNAAHEFFKHFDEEAEYFTFQTFPEPGKNTHPMILHGSLDELKDKLGEENTKGSGVYFCVNATDKKGRKANNITRVRAVFADLDGAPLAPVYQCALDPHIIVESSAGKYHVYWLVDGLGLGEFASIQQSIMDRFNSDTAVKDLPRVLRVPGFVHCKETPFLTRIIFESGALPYSADAIKAEFRPAANVVQGNFEPTGAKGYRAHLESIGAHKGGAGFHEPITRAIAAYISQYGADAPVGPLKDAVCFAISRAQWSPETTQAKINNLMSNRYLDRAIAGAFEKYGEAKKVKTASDVAKESLSLPPEIDNNIVGFDDKRDKKKLASANEDAAKCFDAIRINDLLRAKLEAPEPMLGSWLPCKGLAMVYAQTGIGKSVFCLSVALSVAAGKSLFNWQSSSPKRVLYIDGELPQEYLQHAVRRIAAGLDIDCEDIEIWFVTIDRQPSCKSPKIDAQIDQAALQRLIDDLDIQLIIADNISTLSGSEFGENEAQSWEGMQSWALMQRAHDRAVLFVHHAGKSGAQRGTSKREDVLDATLKLTRLDSGKDGFKIDYDKHRRGPKPEPLEIEFLNESDAMTLIYSSAKSADEELIECWENGMPAGEIGSAIGVSKRTVYNRLNALWKEGKLSRPISGRGGSRN